MLKFVVMIVCGLQQEGGLCVLVAELIDLIKLYAVSIYITNRLRFAVMDLCKSSGLLVFIYLFSLKKIVTIMNLIKWNVSHVGLGLK